jgi:hypothetical protein
MTDLALARWFARRMGREGPEGVLRIVFYGSRARHNPASVKSDYDFVVVLKDHPANVKTIERQLTDVALAGLSEAQAPALDIWVCGLDEWTTALALPGHPLRTAQSEGLVLYKCV